MNKKIRRISSMPPGKTYTALSRGLLIAVCVLIFFPPIWRGLYDELDLAVTSILTALLVLGAIALKVQRKDYRFLRNPLDIAILLYAAAYLLAMINAVHIGEAVWGFLIALNYFLIYWLVAQVIPDLQSARTILNTLLASAAAVAVIGLMAATGYSNYPGAFVEGHIMSTLQYHNTMAAYLGALSFVGIALLLTQSAMSRKLIYSGTIYLLLLVTVTAISKGALLVVMAAALIFFLVIPKKYRWEYLYNLIYIFAISFAVSSLLVPQITGAEPGRGVIVILAGLLLTLAGQFLGKHLLLISRTRYFKISALTIIVVLIMGTGLLIMTPAGQNLMPEDLKEEILEIADFSDASYILRSDFIRWGTDIARDYPLTGCGAGGWGALMSQYQEYRYFAADAHNHVIQVLVETGLFGMMSYIAIWILAIIAVIKYRRRRAQSQFEPIGEDRTLLGGTLTAAAAIGLHALIDFDLSIPAIFIVMVSLLAVLSQLSSFNNTGTSTAEHQAWPRLIPPALLAIILLYGSSRAALGWIYANEGIEALKNIKQDTETIGAQRETAITYLERAAIFNPLNAEVQVNLSKCYASLYLDLAGQESPQASKAYQQTLEAIEKAENLMPFDPETVNGVLNSAASIGNLEASLRLARQTVIIGPNNSQSYEILGEVLYSAALYYLETGDLEKSQAAIDEIKSLPAAIAKQQQRSQEMEYIHPLRKAQITEQLTEIINRAEELKFTQDISSSGSGR